MEHRFDMAYGLQYADLRQMNDQLPGANGFFYYRKVEWNLREALALLAIALARSQSTKGPFEGTFNLKKFEDLVEHLGQGIVVNMAGGGRYYDGPSRLMKDVTSLFSHAVRCGDLRRRANYKYATVELIQWTASLDIDVPGLLPEFSFPTVGDIQDYLKARADTHQAEVEGLRRRQTESRQPGNAITINGPVLSVNQGNDFVGQTFNSSHASSNLSEVLNALRELAQVEQIPDAERRALAVTVEQVLNHAEKPRLQGNWKGDARGHWSGPAGCVSGEYDRRILGCSLMRKIQSLLMIVQSWRGDEVQWILR